jgi:hypothetical protein
LVRDRSIGQGDLKAISRGLHLGMAGGSANARTATVPNSVVLPALVAGMRFSFFVPATNTGPTTLDLEGFTADPAAIAVVRNDTGGALKGGEFAGYCEVEYDGTQFRLLNPSADSNVRDALFPRMSVVNASNFASAIDVETAFSFTGATPTGDPKVYTGFNLANALFTVPVGMGGLWYVQTYANSVTSGSTTVNGHGMRLKRNGVIVSSNTSPGGVIVHCGASFLLPMADGDTAQLFNLPSSAGVGLSYYYMSLVRLGRTS